VIKYVGSHLVLVIVFWVCIPAVEAATFQKADLALVYYDEHSFQLRWIEGGAFSEVLQRDPQKYQLTLLTRQKNLRVSYFLNRLRKKAKFAFSPNVVIKPVIIIEQLQDLFLAYQSQKREETASANETVQTDKNVRAKALMSSDGTTHSKPIGTFSFSPYYHSVYGLHVQIRW